ncbi:SDR family oxidoreductase [Actinomycetes bacterium M1A6_2h]
MITDRLTLVSGGTSGIGAATAVRFAAEGADVLVSSRNASRGEQFAHSLGGRCRFVSHDAAANSADWTAMLDEEVGERSLAAVLLNAGVNSEAYGSTEVLQLLSQSDYDRVLGLNFRGVVNAVRALVPFMSGDERSSIVVMSSTSGFRPNPMDPFYTASKFAGLGLVQALGPALYEQHGIVLTAVCPGSTDTAAIPDDAKVRQPDGTTISRTTGNVIQPSVRVADVIWDLVTNGNPGDVRVVEAGASPALLSPAAPIDP